MKHKISPRMYVPYYVLYHKFQKLNPETLPIIREFECFFGSRDMTRTLWTRLRMSSKLQKILVLLRHTDWKDHFYPIYHEGRVNEYGILADDNELMAIFTASASAANIYDRILSDSLRSTMLDFMHRAENVNYMHSIMQFIKNYPASVSDDRNFTINSKGKMTMLPAGKQTELTENDNWSTTGRTEIAYGRGLRKIFSFTNAQIPDEYIERLSNYLRGQFEFTGKFEIVNRTAIKYWYYMDQYAENQGTLDNSCMKKFSCQPYLQLYVNNPDTVSLLIAKNADDKLVGRALIWKTTQGITFMDRVYGNDQTIQAFLEYAKEHGYWHKTHQNHSSADQVNNEKGEKTSKYLSVKLNTSNLDYLPYMDTFKFSNDIDEGILNNESGDYCLENIDGSWPNDDEWVTTSDGQRIREEDARWSDYEDAWFCDDDVVYSEYHNSYIIYDECIRVNDEYYMPDADCIVRSEYEDEYIHESDAIYSEIMEDYIYDHRAITTLDGEYVDQDAMETRQLMYSTIARETNIDGPELNEHILQVCRFYELKIITHGNMSNIEYQCYKEDYSPIDHVAYFIIKAVKARQEIYSQTTTAS